MVVQHNLTAMNANRYFGINNSKLSKSLEKLSSGYAINRAGDNAAGLAVSEKMRSQIGGLTQAVKNAQDGISMVQTYEGALTETDSILQRMKTLAAQSANGTYQDDVDREAIQLEFDQLNDELDQIADTDFNGVVALNGGQMADGTKAVGGKFDYANNKRAAKQLSSSDINKLDSQGIDNGTGATSNATKLWKDLGFDRTDTNTLNNGPDSVDITFKYDATAGTWSAISATGGASIDGIKTNTAANNGGFQIGSATTMTAPTAASNLVNVVLDGTQLVNGDTITITFNNPSVKNTAIENAGVSSADYDNLTVGTTGPDKTADLTVNVVNAKIETTNNSALTGKMTEDLKKLFDNLDGATVKTTYTAGTAAPTYALTLKDGTAVTDGTAFTVGSTKFLAKSNAGVLEIGFDGTTTGTMGDKLLTLGAVQNGGTAGTDASGSITYTLAVDTANFTKASSPSASVAQPESVVSKSNSNNAATAPLTYSDHVVLQVGARTKDSVDFTFQYSSNGIGSLKANMNCSSREDGLGTKELSLLSQEDANAAIDKIDNAINKVSMVRGTFGAVQNRLEHKIDNLNVTTENLTSAESRIRDTNMAEEMMNFTKQQILSQASQSMLAQANQLPQGVLSLLQ